MIAFLVLLALKPNSIDAATHKNAVPQLHYRCGVRRHTDVGDIEVRRTVDSSGRLLETSALWFARPNSIPEVGAGWIARPGQELDLARGYVNFDIGDVPDLRHYLKGRFSLELSTTANSVSFGVRLKGRPSRLSYLSHAFPDLAVDWADAVALAKGASKLFLNARNERGRLLYSWEVRPELLQTAEREVATAHRMAVAMAEQAAKECQAVDPAEEQGIVLT